MNDSGRTILALVVILIGAILIAMGWKGVTLKQILQSAFKKTPLVTNPLTTPNLTQETTPTSTL